MRSEEQIKERIELAIIEQINKMDLTVVLNEPENMIPAFVRLLTERVHEICIDEIMFRKRG